MTPPALYFVDFFAAAGWSRRERDTPAFRCLEEFTALTAIPEPSSALLAAIGAMFLLRRRRN